MKNVNTTEQILYTAKRSFIKELHHRFTIFRVENKSSILKVAFSIYVIIGLIVSSLIGYKAYAYADNGIKNNNKINTIQLDDKQIKEDNKVIHTLATVTNYNQDNGLITVEYNGEYYQFTSNSQYVDYTKEQYTELAQYNICTPIIVDSKGNIDEDTEAFNNSAKLVVDARQSYIDNNKNNLDAFKVTYTDGSYYIDNQYMNRYVCYNAVNGDIQSWLGSEDMHNYMQENWNNKVPVTSVPCK